MIKTIIALILILLFFFLGQVTYAINKFFAIMFNLILKFLSFFGIKIKTKEASLKVSNEFISTYKGIEKVKLSNKNTKKETSIDGINLSLFIIITTLIIINFLCNNVISNGLYSIQFIDIFDSAQAMNTFLTAILFSALSFNLARIMTKWNQTKPIREENKKRKLREKALQLMSSKELLEEAKKKDEDKYKELKDNDSNR